MGELPLRTRAALAAQRGVGWLLAILWIPAVAFILRFVLGYTIRDGAALRRRYRRLVEEEGRPILLCANHLTMIDSAVVAWALGGSWWYVFHYRHLPWNVPEQRNFAFNWFNRAAAWIAKCIPVVRGGSREQVSGVLRRLRHVLARGGTVLVFPEGGRSRTGRVDPDSAMYGVGRILNAVPECRTLCVYVRGEHQDSWSTVPPRGDTFHADFQVFEPESPHTGLRRARDLSNQIVRKLALMEEEHFAGRE